LIAQEAFEISLESPELEDDKARILEASENVTSKINMKTCREETFDDLLV